jgi:aminoglycoside 3-N-acetyltransferase
MHERVLFLDRKGNKITNFKILSVLKSIKADKCDILYIHTALTFGIPQLKRNELLEELFLIFQSLDIPTIILPTFTFSFPNKEDFDIRNTKTSMGMFNEYFRKKDNVIRSIDPNMSNALYGKHKELITDIGKYSCGKDSTFDLLHRIELNVKFLFFGVPVNECFTFMHYIEDALGVPYRYIRPFTGKIIDKDKKYKDTYYLCVRYANVISGPGSVIYENIMVERNIAQRILLGDNQITVVPEKSAYTLYQDIIQSYPCFFITTPFKESEKNTDFNLNSKMIAL